MLKDVLEKTKKIPELLIQCREEIRTLNDEVKKEWIYNFICAMDPENVFKMSTKCWDEFIDIFDNMHLEEMVDMLNKVLGDTTEFERIEASNSNKGGDA